ncbi:MAG TPA: hypothetical protein VIK14_03430 [Ignavibacteria bacterium]
MDTIKTHNTTVITDLKDTTINQFTKTITFEKYTVDTVYIKNNTDCDWLTPVKDFTITFLWIALIVFIIIFFRKQLKKLITHVKEFSIGKDGVKIVLDQAKIMAFSKSEISPELIREKLRDDNMTNKILSTFWNRQKKFKSDNSRWSFTLFSSSKEYSDFINSMYELIEFGFVEHDKITQQFYLSLKGINLCRQFESGLKKDIFKI